MKCTTCKMQVDVGVTLIALSLGLIVLTKMIPSVYASVQTLLDRPVPWMDKVCISPRRCASNGWTLMHLLLYTMIGACAGFKWRYLIIGAVWEAVEVSFNAYYWCDILWNTIGLALGSCFHYLYN